MVPNVLHLLLRELSYASKLYYKSYLLGNIKPFHFQS